MNRLTAVLGLVFMHGVMQLAIAQEETELNETEQDEEFEKILVTAGKRVQAINEVPGAIQSFSGDNLVRNGITNMDDLTNLIPGASLVNAPAPGWQTVQIRGISTGTTGESTTGYYIDELAFSIPNFQLAPPTNFSDVERVEVLRGPQGTLYGQGSMGGTVKIVTADADTNEFSASVRSSAGGASNAGISYSTDAVVNIPIIDDKLGVRISAGITEVAGFGTSADFPDQDELGEGQSENLRLKVNYYPTDKLSIEATLWQVDTEQEFGSFVDAESRTLHALDEATATALTEGAILADLPDFGGAGDGRYVNDYLAYLDARRNSKNQLDTELSMASVAIEYDLGFADLVSATSYFEYELPNSLSFAGGLTDVNSVFDTDSLSQELRLVSKNQDNVNWIAGFFYTDATIGQVATTTLPDFGPFVGPLFGFNGDVTLEGDVKTESYSVYGELYVTGLGGKLETTLGLRYFEDERTLLDRAGDFDEVDKVDTFNPKLAVKYSINDDWITYLSSSKGFRSGSIQNINAVEEAQALGIATSVLTETDSLWTHEFGSKWSSKEAGLLIDAALYYTEWDNVQLQFATASSIAIANAGDAEITGLDLGIVWQPAFLEDLTVNLTANVNRSEWVGVDPVIAALLGGVQEGGILANNPRRTLSIVFDYTTESGWAGADLFVNLALNHKSPQIESTTGGESAELNAVDFVIGINKFEEWELSLFVDNVFDYDKAIVLTNYLDAPEQRLFPRMIGLRVGYHFN